MAALVCRDRKVALVQEDHLALAGLLSNSKFVADPSGIYYLVYAAMCRLAVAVVMMVVPEDLVAQAFRDILALQAVKVEMSICCCRQMLRRIPQ